MVPRSFPGIGVAGLLLISTAAFSQNGPAPLTQSVPATPTVSVPTEGKAPADLTGLKPSDLGIAKDTVLPAECGGTVLPGEWTPRANALAVCTDDLTKRLAVAEALEKFRAKQKSGSSSGAIDLPDPAASVANLTAKPNYDRVRVTDEGDKGVSVDDGRRRQTTAAGTAGGMGVPDISSLSELTLVGGGCGDVCVAIFRAGERTVSVQRIGEPVALNAQVTAITGKGPNISVTVTLRKPGLSPATKEFRL